jgi:hypothetical protein
MLEDAIGCWIIEIATSNAELGAELLADKTVCSTIFYFLEKKKNPTCSQRDCFI